MFSAPRRSLAVLLGLALVTVLVPNAARADASASYATFIGSSGNDAVKDVAVDEKGNVYVLLESDSYPSGARSIEIIKYDASGHFIWGDHMDVSSGEEAVSLAVGKQYVAIGGDLYGGSIGWSSSWQPTNHGARDAWVGKINRTNGAFEWVSMLGGSGDEYLGGVDVDDNGGIYATGTTFSCDFPVYGQAFQKHPTDCVDNPVDGFVTKFVAGGWSAVYSTYFGGHNAEFPSSIAVSRSSGSALVAGQTWSSDLNVTSGAFDRTYNGDGDGFVLKFDALGSRVLYGTYLGGTGEDQAHGVARDASSNVYVAGQTTSHDLPVTAGAHQTGFSGGECGGSGPGGFYHQDCSDAFVAKIASNFTRLAYATYVGGNGTDLAWDVAVDGTGAAYVVGDTDARDFLATDGRGVDPWSASTQTWGIFTIALTPRGNSLMYGDVAGNETGSSFGWGIGVAPDGSAWSGGQTFSSGFPLTPDAARTTFELGEGVLMKHKPASTTLVFDDQGGNEWWTEVALGGREANSVSKVEARDNDSAWAPMTHEAWGKWGASFHVEPGHTVQYRVTLSNGVVRTSCAFDHETGTCSAGGGGGGGFDADFTNVKGNEWWIQANVAATGGTLARVDVTLDGGATWKPLADKGWGWAASYHAPSGTIVQLRATSTTGATDLSGCYRWTSATVVDCGGSPPPPPPPPPGSFTATFSHVRGNEWWIETDVTTSGGTLGSVSARVTTDTSCFGVSAPSCGPWVLLDHTSWGSWAKSMHAPPGSYVEFVAQSTDGQQSWSTHYAWPPA